MALLAGMELRERWSSWRRQLGLGEQTRTTHLAVDERGRLVADVTCEPSFELPTCEDPEHETLVFSPAGEFVGQR